MQWIWIISQVYDNSVPFQSMFLHFLPELYCWWQENNGRNARATYIEHYKTVEKRWIRKVALECSSKSHIACFI